MFSAKIEKIFFLKIIGLAYAKFTKYLRVRIVVYIKRRNAVQKRH